MCVNNSKSVKILAGFIASTVFFFFLVLMSVFQLNCDPHFMCYSNSFITCSLQNLKMEHRRKGPIQHSCTHVFLLLCQEIFTWLLLTKIIFICALGILLIFSLFVTLVKMFSLFDYLVQGYS